MSRYKMKQRVIHTGATGVGTRKHIFLHALIEAHYVKRQWPWSGIYVGNGLVHFFSRLTVWLIWLIQGKTSSISVSSLARVPKSCCRAAMNSC